MLLKLTTALKYFFGVMALRNKKYDRAIQIFEPDAVDGFTSVEFLVLSAQAYYYQEQYHKSLDLFICVSGQLHQMTTESKNDENWKKYMENYIQYWFSFLHIKLSDKEYEVSFEFDDINLDLVSFKTKSLFPLKTHPDWIEKA